MSDTKKLYRSRDDKIISGVCAGIADYLKTDPTIIRLLWIIITILGEIVPGVLLYIAFAIIVPEEPAKKRAAKTSRNTAKKTVTGKTTRKKSKK